MESVTDIKKEKLYLTVHLEALHMVFAYNVYRYKPLKLL